MRDYSRRLTAFTRKTNLANIRASLKTSKKSKGYLDKRRGAKKNKGGNDSGSNPSRDDTWAGAEQAERPPTFGEILGPDRKGFTGKTQPILAGFGSLGISRLRAIEQYRKLKNRPAQPDLATVSAPG